jgi:hypothetical protein
MSVGREWKVRLDLELSPEVHDRITRRIQQAVLAELAEIDVASGYSISLRGPGDRGHVVREGETDPFADDFPIGPGGMQTDGIVAREAEEPFFS